MKAFKNKCLYLLVLLLVISCAKDEEDLTGSIYGKVTDTQSGEVLHGATVTLTPGGISRTTGDDGTYEFLNLEPGQYQVEARKADYVTNTKSVSVVTGKNAMGDITLTPVKKDAKIELGASTLNFGKTNTSLSFDIFNKGTAKFNWNISGLDKVDWLEVNPASGALEAGKSCAVQVSLLREKLTENKELIIIINADKESVSLKITAEVERKTSKIEIIPSKDDTETTECYLILYSPMERGRYQQTDNSAKTKVERKLNRKNMKYTDRELEEILNKLIASTRSPRGRFSAAASYPQLEKKLKFHHHRLYPVRTFAAAAAVVLLCLSVWAAYLYMQPVSIQTVTTLAETRTILLPDGTSVTLNHYSSLSYPKQFKSDNREVELSGEAYFEVSKSKKHPFIVQTETIDVQVLGTHFNVDAYPDNPDVKTTLLTGSVAVSNKNNSVHMVLKPNEVAIYNKVEQKLTRKVLENAGDEVSWRHGEFIFDDLPLQEIARELSNSFGTTIHIADSTLRNYRVTARFRNGEDLETILSVLHNAGYFNYSRNTQQITITPKLD